MKKVLLVLLSLLLFLTSCADVPRLTIEVKTEDGVYRNGFYNDLYVIEPELHKKAFKYGDQQFYYLPNERFDLRMTYENSAEATAFCATEQWEEAKAFYSKDENFYFYCLRGNIFDLDNSEIFLVPDMDYEKFNMLYDFAETNGYDPFGAENKNTKRIINYEHSGNCEIVFYKESKDGVFTSFKGHEYHLLDGKLVLVYYYDANHGEKDELVYVEVPRDIAVYFEELLENMK